MSHLGQSRRFRRVPSWSGETQSPDVRSESDVPFIGLKAWRGPGKVRTLETFIPAERFMFWILSIRERKRWRLRRKCPRNLRLQPEALPPWTEKNSLRSRERAVKAYRTKNAVFRKITDWRLKLGERADKVSIPPSVAFRAIIRSPLRPAARADMPHIAGRTSRRPRMRHPS
jgi:hypothetical protein